MLRCSVVGATSFTGNELIRILARHPHVKVGTLTTRSEERIRARDVVPTLGKANDLVIEKFDFRKVLRNSDVVFITLPHTLAMNIAGDFYKHDKIVIDLSADFRLRHAKIYEQWYGERHEQKKLLKFAVYGLPEIYREQIKHANLIANPGCYPTGAVLGLYPLLKNDLIQRDSIIIDSKSGASGAGRKLSMGTQFCEVDENFAAYKVNRHQHAPEMEPTLSEIAAEKINITFVPHLLPVNRGILSTIYVKRKSGVKKDKLAKAFQAFADAEPFVRFLGVDRFPALKNVQFTNFCDIGVSVDDKSNQVIVITAIDNLLKGASGQAIQNMNIRLGFAEEAGLLSL
ncbi:MAG: N-acetyl-gamma-glutamyl-phosphate reductase [Omnitrophica bacterium RIFCSPLOWO2_01_FULL_45_10b]|nr:MAG: N-acetyl-gamma-glutamyl-phosphate reductase [Omnitrophica bacterium RIFCSPLOWO2_01_FULL_45_10b]